MVQQPALGIGAFHGMRSRSARSTWDSAILAGAFWLKLSPVSWRIKAEKTGAVLPTLNAPRNHKKRVGRYCGTYTGPLFTVHLYQSETSGVAEGGKRQILAVLLAQAHLRSSYPNCALISSIGEKNTFAIHGDVYRNPCATANHLRFGN